MKRFTQFLVIIITLLCSLSLGLACTSFAVYSQDVIYGMNFDYPETEIKLVVNDNDKAKSFTMMFKHGDYYYTTVSINDKGLFISTQMQYPLEVGKRELSRNEIFVSEIQKHISKFNNVEEILTYLEHKILVQRHTSTVHNLIADVEVRAAIIEAGKEKNEIIPINDDFIAMTNFKNSNYRTTPYHKVSGVGANRYKKVYKYIVENKDDFSISNAFTGLEMTAQHGRSPTLCSMVFMPDENCVYVALHRNFDKLWKITIDDKTIETFQGFDKSIKLQIPNSGVIVSDLINSNFSNYDLPYDATAVDTHNINNNNANYQSKNLIMVIIAMILILFVRIFQKRRD